MNCFNLNCPPSLTVSEPVFNVRSAKQNKDLSERDKDAETHVGVDKSYVHTTLYDNNNRRPVHNKADYVRIT
jgi:hypothetical protein